MKALLACLLCVACAAEQTQPANEVAIPEPPPTSSAEPTPTDLAPAATESAEQPQPGPPPVQTAETPPSLKPVLLPSQPKQPPAAAGAAAAAERLFDEGRQAMSQGDIALACVKFDQSFQIDPAVGTLFNLANCQEKLGRTSDACRSYRGAEQMARTRGQEDRAKIAAERAKALKCP